MWREVDFLNISEVFQFLQQFWEKFLLEKFKIKKQKKIWKLYIQIICFSIFKVEFSGIYLCVYFKRKITIFNSVKAIQSIF